MSSYTVRPFSRAARSDLKDALRIYLSPSALALQKLHAGDAISLESSDGRAMQGIVWPAMEKIQDAIVQTSKVFQEMSGLKLGDRVSIRRLVEPPRPTETVVLAELGLNQLDHLQKLAASEDEAHWLWFLDFPLGKAEYLSNGLVLENVELRGEKRTLQVVEVNGASSKEAIFRYQAGTTLRLGPDVVANESIGKSLLITKDGIGGLTIQLQQLNERVAAYSGSLSRMKLPSYYRARRGGVLLYGQPGTGKTLLLGKIAQCAWKKVYHITSSGLQSRPGSLGLAIGQIFAEARRHEPSVIIIDRLERLAGRSTETDLPSLNIAAALSQELGQNDDARVLVVAATTRLTDIDERLRRPGCLEHMIEIPVPDSRARTEILKVLSHVPADTKDASLSKIGDRSHGYVGADLDKLVQLAVDIAKRRILSERGQKASVDHLAISDLEDELSAASEIVVTVQESDLDAALAEIRPTAMQEVFLETPKVQWIDIGGQYEVKKALQQAVEWPLKHASSMARLGISPKKGLLLYGPPGCSKTLTAAAVATSSGLNFLAVKGAELLSMYVGESERAVRDVFRKARAARPSILFFDEIDAIGGGGGGEGRPQQHAGLNVLTTLLNELDGIETLTGVFVLAATNKPEVLDPALLRPGRLDASLYVGPPDWDGRLEILKIRTRNMDVDAGLKLDELASRTEGYSGAELVSVCQRAGYAALEEEERATEERGDNLEESIQVSQRHFEFALQKVLSQITPEMIARYERWQGKAIK